MKLRKSLIKPVTWQNMFGNYETEKITHKASDVAEYVWFFHLRSYCTTHLMLFSECLPIYASSCMMTSGRSNRTTRYNCRFSVASLALRVIFVCQKRPPIYASCMTISGARTEQHIMGFGEQAAVD